MSFVTAYQKDNQGLEKPGFFNKKPNPLGFGVLLGFGLYCGFWIFLFERAIRKLVG